MNRLPPIHLINLDRSTERLSRFNQRNSHLNNIVRVSAVDGSSLDRKALIRSGHISRDLPYSAGTLGCALSHLGLWKTAVSQNRSLTIFEDDIVVCRRFQQQAQEILSALPDDWDFIQWGYNFNPSFVWVDLGVSRAKLECYGPANYQGQQGLKNFQDQAFPAAPVKLLHSFGFQGYSISPKGARAALAFSLPLRERLIAFPDTDVTTEAVALDVVLCGLYPTLKAFICIPQLLIPDVALLSDRVALDEEDQVVGDGCSMPPDGGSVGSSAFPSAALPQSDINT